MSMRLCFDNNNLVCIMQFKNSHGYIRIKSPPPKGMPLAFGKRGQGGFNLKLYSSYLFALPKKSARCKNNNDNDRNNRYYLSVRFEVI